MSDSMRDSGGPAFPKTDVVRQRDFSPAFKTQFGSDGMSLRDYFAGQVLANSVLAPYTDDGGWNEHTVARGAYLIADAMLRAREAKP